MLSNHAEFLATCLNLGAICAFGAELTRFKARELVDCGVAVCLE